jgi:hypothetical protein
MALDTRSRSMWRRQTSHGPRVTVGLITTASGYSLLVGGRLSRARRATLRRLRCAPQACGTEHCIDRNIWHQQRGKRNYFC